MGIISDALIEFERPVDVQSKRIFIRATRAIINFFLLVKKYFIIYHIIIILFGRRRW